MRLCIIIAKPRAVCVYGEPTASCTMKSAHVHVSNTSAQDNVSFVFCSCNGDSETPISYIILIKSICSY